MRGALDIGVPEFCVERCTDGSLWRAALGEIGRHDFVHTFDFHEISAGNGEGDPVAFVVRDASGKVLALWPALRRPIGGSTRHDLTSVYGYGGPVFGRRVDASRVIQAIFEEMRNSGAVSLFSRMHPLFVGEIEDTELRGERLSDVVVIPVISSDDPPQGYRGSHRREITKNIANGVSVADELSPESISNFKTIYDSTMRSIGARDYYIFDDTYYRHLMNARDFSIELLTAKINGVAISSALFVQTGDIVQYYLSGTLNDYRKLAPSKILIAEAHRRAVGRGIRHLVLGGGVGSAQDALFEFKAGFSDLHLPFHVTRKILDPEAYNSLCGQRGIDPAVSAFFPAYRV